MMESSAITISSSQTADSSDKVTCGVCRRQFSRYTCPACNVPYCSLTCFRSEAHSHCSETFYRKEIESGIKTESSKTAEEKRKMIDLLKRIEEQGPEDDFDLLYGDEKEDGEMNLTARLQDLDINTASTDALWSLLNEDERAKFMKAVKDPSSLLAQQLLASEELERYMLEPWWEANSLEIDAPITTPKAMSIPANMTEPDTCNPSLVYNVCAILIAYVYATRHLSTSPLSSLDGSDSNSGEPRKIISNLVPFLVDRRSTVLYRSLNEVILAVWSRFEPGNMDSRFFSVLLRDTAQIIRPNMITVLPSSTPRTGNPSSGEVQLSGHPHLLSVLALSDVASIFHDEKTSGRTNATSRNRDNHVVMKLTFYAARQVATPSAILQLLADELLARSNTMEGGSVLLQGGVTPSEARRAVRSMNVVDTGVEAARGIVELDV